MTKVRRRHHRLKDRPLVPFLLLSAPVSFIFFFGSFLQTRFDEKEPKRDRMMSLLPRCNERPRISYHLDRTHHDDDNNNSNNNNNNNNGTVLRYAAVEDDCHDKTTTKPISVLRWAQLLSHNDTAYATSLAQNLTQILKDAPFRAFYFETKGVTARNADRKAFEFVLVDAPRLYRFADGGANPRAFAEHFGNDSDGVVFANLGNTSTLIAPVPPKKSEGDVVNAYGHLAAFVRRGPADQVHKVWRLAAETYWDRLESETLDASRPVWFSTSGTGISWLHFRLDDRPKYYTYSAFANEK